MGKHILTAHGQKGTQMSEKGYNKKHLLLCFAQRRTQEEMEKKHVLAKGIKHDNMRNPYDIRHKSA